MKKALIRITASLIFCLGLLISFLLNPHMVYANSTTHKNITIHHNGEIDSSLKEVIDISLKTIKGCKIYNSKLRTDLCINEGIYPKVVKAILGDDVFTAFSNKVVVLGKPTGKFNQFEKWGTKMKYSQFLSHALIHNLQYKHHGIWDANPLGGHPAWKWEGYVEYEVLGELASLDSLVQIITDPKIDDYEWVYLNQEEGTVKRHIEYLTVVKYCFDVLGWNYEELMASKMSEDELLKEVIARKEGD